MRPSSSASPRSRRWRAGQRRHRPTKTLAKLISDLVKPSGCGVVVNDADRRRLLHGKPVTEITGIARRSAERLAKHGITTCDQFANADRAFIRWLLTKRGEDLWWELNGTPVQPIHADPPGAQVCGSGREHWSRFTRPAESRRLSSAIPKGLSKH